MSTAVCPHCGHELDLERLARNAAAYEAEAQAPPPPVGWRRKGELVHVKTSGHWGDYEGPAVIVRSLARGRYQVRFKHLGKLYEPICSASEIA